jgi:hypothetical protein
MYESQRGGLGRDVLGARLWTRHRRMLVVEHVEHVEQAEHGPRSERSPVRRLLEVQAVGVTNFRNPSAHGGINLDGAGFNPAAPACKAASNVCVKLLPGGGPRRKPTTQDKQ